MTELDERTLELLREQSGLSIDLEGRFCHRGEPITHRRTLEVLWRSLERRPDGRYLVRVGRESGYVRVEDAPYAVRGIALEGGAAHLHLGDGSVHPLDPTTLSLDPAGVLHCVVKGGHRARFTRTAQVDLGLALEEDPRAPGRFLLRLDGREYEVAVEG
ncbi:MAG TPA: hypothetical protein VM683_13945 [Anaeromyxobacteraceae bacterium]|nr:hypothetical protein [Anaeromyxobacteraceae bacterium]